MSAAKTDTKKVFVTNRTQLPGQKEISPGTLYAFAHQAYWGFRFLAEKRNQLWEDVVGARSIEEIERVGIVCTMPGITAGAGFGARNMLEQLADIRVARQVLAAKRDAKRYPRSPRPSSEDRRMIFLGIAVAAGICNREYSTALRKLAEANLGPERIADECHRFDRAQARMKERNFVRAEEVEGGYMLTDGTQEGFSTTLPLELKQVRRVALKQQQARRAVVWPTISRLI